MSVMALSARALSRAGIVATRTELALGEGVGVAVGAFDVKFVNKPLAAYTAGTPYRDDVLLPLTWLILYQLLPETAFPLQVVLQLLPLTVAMTVTFVPAASVAFFVPSIDALVRTFTPLHAVCL